MPRQVPEQNIDQVGPKDWGLVTALRHMIGPHQPAAIALPQTAEHGLIAGQRHALGPSALRFRVKAAARAENGDALTVQMDCKLVDET
jgi:hypothetical protein